jgi:hypothetical protein
MRVHLSREVIEQLHALKEQGAPLRQAIEALKQNPMPADVLALENRPSEYELFSSGYWITYEIDRTGAETVIRVSLIEKN